MRAIDPQLKTPRTACNQPDRCPRSGDEVGSSKVWSPQALTDRWEALRTPVDDPRHGGGEYALWAPEKRIDGYLVGGDQMLYPPTASLRTLPPLLPQGTQKVPEPERRVDLIHVNGIGTPARNQYADMAAAVNHLSEPGGVTGAIRGVHNGTDGWVQDVLQAAGDKFALGRNRAVETLKD